MRRVIIGVVAALLSWQGRAAEVHVASQYGFGFLPMMVMQHDHLFEKRLAAAGQPDTEVKWSTLGAGSAMNDALLSGGLDIASGGVAPFITLWSRAKNVKAISALSAMPLWFNTRDPNVKSLEDLTGKDKIAMTAPKISVHAILLQIAATKRFGIKDFGHYDALTLAMSHPDATSAMLSGAINNHFAAPPFQYIEAGRAGIRTIATADDILGGPATFILTWTTAKFRSDNPVAYQAFVDATKDAVDMINRDLPAAAAIYLDVSHDKMPLTELLPMLRMPGTAFTMTPQNVMTYAKAMFDFGTTKVEPKSWQEMFFPEVHALPGS